MATTQAPPNVSPIGRDTVRVEGAVKEGVFVATAVAVMGPPMTGGPAERPGPPPQ